ncbi:osmoprotectant transport system ATP-binding protein [Atopostipes suicloacalis DSM 15692]|uniref:ABC-type quaternary amine transporter n=1 Tax=Atopostipes suicloacalis DSM 15692 TaxID=1121025 RepID=A0A1M4SP62_9LACT|nr:ABC transporter ATP-binding protein [Atopostipes suicloacalis]SHE34033.1 osmoprotectant transport system ATP-binding protein [Atopostipes suicloacalis DSM 15692]
MIKFCDVSKVYDTGKHAVTGLNLNIKDGEFFVLIGPSGCGKTTTLKMINRLIPLTTGYIYVKDKPITEYNIQQLRWNMGYVLQQIALFPNMTVEENIRTVPEMKKWSKDKMKDRVTELLESVDLDAKNYRHRKISELSGGEQQRVGVLRAFAADPDIILMDEPFSALDPISRQNLQEDVAKMHKKWNKTIVFVTHDMQEAMSLGERIALMEKGKIVQVGTPYEIINHPKNDFVRQFLESGNIETAEDQTIQQLIDEKYFSSIESPESTEQMNIVLSPEDSVNELIVALSKETSVFIENRQTQSFWKITNKEVMAYLAANIESRGDAR